eukprot:CAMPEP_0170591096 /NCGR_PEP_ID=MMETSP0224-20130122/12220_1 /TAXON_ID=285029 /ORGANISM="Togula jolla, Strain CCCM 725" /LENGTH=61 /DNA_ID=CAMNT_0010914935 /DNA_START=336 /DNA_END=518 /DNA_ORIENTATION=+
MPLAGALGAKNELYRCLGEAEASVYHKRQSALVRRHALPELRHCRSGFHPDLPVWPGQLPA